jgi:hypothetical protein
VEKYGFFINFVLEVLIENRLILILHFKVVHVFFQHLMSFESSYSFFCCCFFHAWQRIAKTQLYNTAKKKNYTIYACRFIWNIYLVLWGSHQNFHFYHACTFCWIQSTLWMLVIRWVWVKKIKKIRLKFYERQKICVIITLRTLAQLTERSKRTWKFINFESNETEFSFFVWVVFEMNR